MEEQEKDRVILEVDAAFLRVRTIDRFLQIPCFGSELLATVGILEISFVKWDAIGDRFQLEKFRRFNFVLWSPFFFRTNNLRYRIQCKNRISVSLISSLVCINKCLESVTSDTPKAFTFHQLVLDRLYLWHLLQLQLISIYSLIARTRFQHLATFPFARYPLTYVASYSVPSPYRYRS